MEVFFTIITGVIVFLVCEYMKEIWLEPLQEYKRHKESVARALVLYANFYSNPVRIDEKHDMPEHYAAASDELRKLAADIAGFAEIIHGFHPGIPEPEVLIEVSANLIGISNCMHGPFNMDPPMEAHGCIYADGIKELLKLHIRKTTGE